MKVLDVNSLQTGIDDTVTEIDSFYSQIGTIQKAIQSLIVLDDALKGETGKAIRAFYDECHRPFLIFLYQSLVDRMNFIISATSYVTSICSCKRINTTTWWSDIAINRDYAIH